MKKTYFLYIVIAFMMLLNVTTIIFVWKYYPKPKPRPNLVQPLNPGDFIIRELGFNEKQRKDFDVLQDEHRQLMNENRDSVRKCREQLYELSPSGDTKQVEKFAEEIGKLEKEKELITFQHFQEIRALCNNRQKEKFDGIIRQVLQIMKTSPEPVSPSKKKR